MKLNKLVILSIFLLAILLLGAVSAEGNNTQTDEEIAQDINVTFPEKVYKENPVEINVELPDAAEGRLIATVDEVEIYNETITNKSVKIPVTIPPSKFPYIVVNRGTGNTTQEIDLFYNGTITNNLVKNLSANSESKSYNAVNRMSDYTLHKIGLFYNNVALNLTHNLKLMNYKPDHDYWSGIPEEILQYDDSHYQSTSLIFPYSANGTVEVYIDGNFSERLNTKTFTVLNISNFNSLILGNHTVRIVYSGDDYYNASDRTFNFTVVDMLIHIPKNIVLEHDDCLTAKIVNNSDGMLYVYVNSKQVIAKRLDKNGEFLESLFEYVKCGPQEIEVIYLAKNFKKSKKVLVNVSYYVDSWGFGFTYGEEGEVIITVPTDFNKKLITITIDGVKVDKFTIDNSGWIELDTSKLSAGNHTLYFDFKGDEKYNKCNLTYNFTISYNIICPDGYADDYSKVTLNLPSNATGSLEVYIDGKLFKSQKFTSGKASISLKGLESGDHDISARYTGTDFEVEDVNTSIWVPAKPTINATNKNVYYTDNAKYSVKIILEGKADDDAYVLIKVAGKEYERYTNSKGVVSVKLPKLKPGTYKISIWCKDVKMVKTLTVKKILSLKTVKIKKSAKKLVLTATLKKGKKAIKGKYVTFKFKGVTYKVKTNKYGVAKLTIKKSVLKKLKIGKKYAYQVSYLKSTVKKVAKVKR